MTEKPQEAQISLWKMVEGLECQLDTTEAINAALRTAQDNRKGQGMAGVDEARTIDYRAQQAIEQARFVASMAERLAARVYDYETQGNSGTASLHTTESINRMITQTRTELLELKELL